MRQFLTALTLLSLIAPLPVGAFNATSTGFYVRQNVQSISGGNATFPFSTSTSFMLLSAGGQTALGTSTSGTSFSLYSGILQNLFESVKPIYAQTHYHWRLNNGTETTATAVVAEDTATTSVQLFTPQRLRIQIANLGGTEAQYDTQQLVLEYAYKAFPCDDNSNNWFVLGSVGDGVDWEATSSQLVNFADTTNISTSIGGVTDSNHTFMTTNHGSLETGAVSDILLSIPSDSFVEYEYSIAATNFATAGGTYCFRLYDSAYGSLYRFDTYPEATIVGGNSLPVASAVSIDSGATSVTLTENTTKNVVCAGTVTDNDGFANISAVGGFLYRTGVGTTSASDNNNLYRLYGDSQCVPSGGSGNSETYTCTFPVQYYADATDAGSPNSGDNWTCELHPRDTIATGTPAIDTTEMASLMALNVSSSIPYGSVNANTDTGVANPSVVVYNTGNRDMDPEVSGTSMAGAGTIAASQQKYLSSPFTYSGGGTALSGTPTAVNLSLPQRTSDETRAAPILVQEAETAWNSETSPKTTSSFSVRAGDTIVAYAMVEEGTASNRLSISGGSLTWNPEEEISTGGNVGVMVWSATVDSNKTMDVSFSVDCTGGFCAFGGNALVFRDSAGVSASNSGTGSGAPTLNITTTQSDSAVVVANGDWDAGNGARTWRTNAGSFTEQTYNYYSSHYTAYGGYHPDAGAVGTYAVGLTAPTQTYGIAALEVLGASGGDIISDLLYWGLGVPNGTPNGSYTGTNTFTAAAGI